MLDIALKKSIAGEVDESEKILRTMDPNDPRVCFNMGWHQMRHGNLKVAMSLLEKGRKINVFGNGPIKIKIPEWNGQPLNGKHVLLRSEGGLGDQIINVRFAKNLKAMGAKVITQCSPSLMPVFARAKGVDSVISEEGISYTYMNYWIPAMSAAGRLGLDFSQLDGSPYLIPNSDYVKRWKPIIAGPELKIGLRWRGNTRFDHETHRQFNPEKLFNVADIKETRVFSLQRDDGVELLPKNGGIIDLSSFMKTWEDTLAIMSCLDLVITSCTSIAHAAGALGIPTWVIIPVMPYYMWCYPWNEETTPWYDNTRLFRQKKYGSWDEPINEVIKEVHKLI